MLRPSSELLYERTGLTASLTAWRPPAGTWRAFPPPDADRLAPVPMADCGDVEIEYEAVVIEGPPVLLIMGLGAQLTRLGRGLRDRAGRDRAASSL